ncbi:TIGR02466 family protein [Caulobacter sp. KR2-114]|uniref:TIGR02466 family protein n=1 Tax=Caulobacter sp. KR2-114 TaxID=3400912 RepID=UPI003C063A61
MTTRSLFATQVYEASLAGEAGFADFNAELADACRMLAEEDRAGRAWCKTHGYGGYTSYASLDDLPQRATAFADLKRRLDRHAGAFAEALAFDLGPRGRLKLDSLWVNLLKPGAAHSGHIHPHSVLSGTYYVDVPAGASGLRLEDPRLALMMAAPPRRSAAPEEQRAFVTLSPAPGTLFLWESWLRHEVPANSARSTRISISFNYGWR